MTPLDSPFVLAACVGASLFLLTLIVILYKTKIDKFYPSGSELAALYAKLFIRAIFQSIAGHRQNWAGPQCRQDTFLRCPHPSNIHVHIHSPIYKVWLWQSQIKPTMKLNSNLTFELPFEANLKNAKDYVDVCNIRWGEKNGKELPPFYPATMFLYPTVCLLSKRMYLFPVLGAIHVKNYFRLHAPLVATKKYKGILKVQEEVTLVKKGVEVSFPQILLDEAGKEVWVSTTTVLVPARHKYWDKNATAKMGGSVSLVDEVKAQGLNPKLLRIGEYKTARNTGLTYAAIVNDYNPIHLYPWSAKLFGFPKPIAHGMYICAKVFHEALEEWTEAGLSYPVEAHVKFIKPVVLPSWAVFTIHRVEDPKQGPKLIITVRNPDKPDVVHLQGSLRAYKP